jgi:anthranilate 1,2-dioxygenase large subunit
MLYAKAATSNAAVDSEVFKDVRSFDTSFKLSDPSVLHGRPDFDDGIALVIMSLFPNLVIQQIANTLTVRQIVTDKTNGFELVWTQFGYVDDDQEMRDIRVKQSNLIGPAGYVSMGDDEAVEIVQKAVRCDHDRGSYIAMGGGRAEDAEHLVTESAIIGFREHYKSLLSIAA